MQDNCSFLFLVGILPAGEEKEGGMEIRECIGRVDHVKPNQYGIEEKVGWLSYLDGTIWNDIIKTHEDAPEGEFEPYVPEDTGRELLAGVPYDEMYCAYLKMRIDEANGETGRYNNSAAMFNAHLEEFAKYYNRTHLPLDAGRFRIL